MRPFSTTIQLSRCTPAGVTMWPPIAMRASAEGVAAVGSGFGATAQAARARHTTSSVGVLIVN